MSSSVSDILGKLFGSVSFSGTGPVTYEPYTKPVENYIQEKKPSMVQKLVQSIKSQFEPINIKGVGTNNDDLSYLNNEQPQVLQANTFRDYINEQGKSGVNENNTKYLEENIFPYTDAYGIPRQLAAGIWAAEGRYGTQNPIPAANNYWNLMFNGQIHPYESMDNATRDFDLTLKNIIGTNMGKKDISYKDYAVGDLIKALQLLPSGEPSNLRYEGHSQDPSEYVDFIQSVPEYRHYNP